jgi:hypothetical protein
VDALEKTAKTTIQTVQIRSLAQIRAQTMRSALRSALTRALTRAQRNVHLLRAQNNAPLRRDLPNALKRAVPIRAGLMRRKDLGLRRDRVSLLAMEKDQRKRNLGLSAKRRSPTKRSVERNLLLSVLQRRAQRSQMNAHQRSHAHLKSLRNARRTLTVLNSIIVILLSRGN